MKRVKIMLLSFALLAIVGGALAFKANYGPLNFCYTTTTAPVLPPTCSLVTFTEDPTGIVIYTTPSVKVNGVDQCKFKADGITRLTCTTPTTVILD